MTTQLKAGQFIPRFSIEDVSGKKINSRDLEGKKVYITFLRNTACPLCSFHVFRLLKLSNQLKENNVEVIAFYESKRQVILTSPFFRDQVLNDKKMIVISDTAREVYTLFGAEVNPQKATFEILRAHGRIPKIEEAAKNGFNGDGIQQGTNADAIPADFLVDEAGMIVYAHYGIDAGDNIALEKVEDFAVNAAVVK
jgi:peroxiredoxin